MRSIKRSIPVMLSAFLLAAALPAAAVVQPPADADQPTLGLFARVEALIAKVWTLTARPFGPGISEGGTAGGSRGIEAAGVTRKIGPTIEEVGAASPADGSDPPPVPEGAAGQVG